MHFTVTTPIDGTEYSEHTYHSWSETEQMLKKSVKAQEAWAERPLEDRLELIGKWISKVEEDSERLAEELTYQIGRPLAEAPFEIEEFGRRSRRVIELAPQSVARYDERQSGRLRHYVEPEPLGVVLVQAGWNYPFIISAHSVVPALAVGNSVILRYSSQTPACGTRLEEAFLEVGGPPGLLQALRLGRQMTERLYRTEEVAQVAVTGALPIPPEEGVRRRRRRHISLGLDLGGKDPAYVRADADLDLTTDCLVKAAYANAGQSCCGVERIYVASDIYDSFLEKFKGKVEKLVLGDPRDPHTTLGPMVRFQAAAAVFDQVNSSIKQGAVALLPNNPPERAYFSPQILTNVDHGIKLMSEETFGPAVGVMKIDSDEEAVELMNDSRYALGASVWTGDVEKGLELAKKVSVYTSYVNHCDHLDPAIAFLGVNGSPRGFTLSHFGFEMLTANRSYWVGKSPKV